MNRYPALTRCLDCWQPVNWCVCSREDADRYEAQAIAQEAAERAEYDRKYGKSYQAPEDWFAEDRPLHRVQREEGIEE